MAVFTSFQNILPDPDNTIGTAGQVAGTAGPGYASVKLSSENRTMRTRTNSGRLIARTEAYHKWKINITYNPMTRDDFDRIYTFLIAKRGGLEPFFVSLPQNRIPKNTAFATWTNNSGSTRHLQANTAYTAGLTTLMLEGSSYNNAANSNGAPQPGDLFTVGGTNSNHLKAYMVTRTETSADYNSNTGSVTSSRARIHFTPGLAKSVANGDNFIFHNPLIKVVLVNDIQEYSLGSNNLYQFGLQLEEVQ